MTLKAKLGGDPERPLVAVPLLPTLLTAQILTLVPGCGKAKECPGGGGARGGRGVLQCG